MRVILPILLVLILASCSGTSDEYTERTILQSEEGFKYVSRSYPDKELDSIWKYDLNGNLVSLYTGDSLGQCFGWTSGYRKTGELHYFGECYKSNAIGQWLFFTKSGELDFLNFYSDGDLYQRWILDSGDTSKWVYPIIIVEPPTAYVFDTVSVKVDYILDGIDTTNWDFYLQFDFVERNRFEGASPLPYEQFIEKYEGQPINRKFEFLMPEEMVLYGQTMAVHRKSGDTIFHPEIENRFLTILDSTSVEF